MTQKTLSFSQDSSLQSHVCLFVNCGAAAALPEEEARGCGGLRASPAAAGPGQGAAPGAGCRPEPPVTRSA